MTIEEIRKNKPNGATYYGFDDKDNIVYLRKHRNKWERFDEFNEWRYLIFTLRNTKPL